MDLDHKLHTRDQLRARVLPKRQEYWKLVKRVKKQCTDIQAVEDLDGKLHTDLQAVEDYTLEELSRTFKGQCEKYRLTM